MVLLELWLCNSKVDDADVDGQCYCIVLVVCTLAASAAGLDWRAQLNGSILQSSHASLKSLAARRARTRYCSRFRFAGKEASGSSSCFLLFSSFIIIII